MTLPQNAKLHYNFANFLRESEQQENAIKHYKEALRWVTKTVGVTGIYGLGLNLRVVCKFEAIVYGVKIDTYLLRVGMELCRR